jgi:hypothetical protein
MNIATFTWWLVGACVVYAIAIDENVHPWLILQSKSLGIWIQRKWYLVRYHPESPWVRWEIDRNADKMAKEIMKENENR